MDEARRAELAQAVLELSPADATEVLVSTDAAQLTRFTHNAIHQNVASSDVEVSVRAIVGKRTGVAATNAVNPQELRATVERAVALAKLAPEDPDRPPLPAGQRISPAPTGSFAAQTASATPAMRASLGDSIFEVARGAGYWCAGYVKTRASGITIANSEGTRASFDGTDSGINVKMIAADSSGYAEQYRNDAAQLDAVAAAAIAKQKARASAHPKAAEPGDWTVILEPPAFGELFAYLSDHFSAQSYDEGSSFLSGTLGTRCAGENVTIRDDYANPHAPAMPFDFEGAPKQQVTIVDRGIARAIVTDSYWAAKLRVPNTGHALPAPNPYGPQATNLVVGGGTKSVAQLIAESERALLVSRFWYIRTVDQKKAIVTGMTRDGTFLVEDGEIKHGVRNMRFNQSILDSLNRCEFSVDQHRTGDYWFSIVVPAAKIEGFRFSSGTDF